jgi:hypothetical protein
VIYLSLDKDKNAWTYIFYIFYHLFWHYFCTNYNTVDNSQDVSIFYSLSEEEEKKRTWNFEKLGRSSPPIQSYDLLFYFNDIKVRHDTTIKKYPIPHLNLISLNSFHNFLIKDNSCLNQNDYELTYYWISIVKK